MSQQAQAVTVPPSKKRPSERWPATLAIRIFGYERLVGIYAEILRYGRVAKAWQKESRAVLTKRAQHIAALKQAEASAPAPVKAATPIRDRSELKIALFIPGFLNGKGGAEKVAGKLAHLLARSNITVHVACRPPESNSPPYPLDESIPVRALFEKDDAQIAALRSEGYDLMVGFGMPHFYSRIPHISRVLDVPFVIQECNNPRFIGECVSESHCCRSEEEAYWLRQAVFAHARGVRMTVPAYAESVVDEVKPFTYAFFNALVPPGTRSLRRTPAKKLICVSAMKNENKNGLAAVEAFCRFSSRMRGWSLHLYGPNKFGKEMERLGQRFPHAAVVDHGIVDDVEAIYGDAYALIIPSFEEGLPNVVVEALSYGVPCIGFADCSGVKHLITDEETGLLIEREDPLALDKALGRIADPDLRRDLSRTAQQFADEKLRPEAWEANWLRLIGNAANERNNRAEPQIPAACVSQGTSAPQWGALLDTYLHFGE
jgi:glycosyltransferase involved in cell wall biosynthesis